jgi:hypothetical protein
MLISLLLQLLQSWTIPFWDQETPQQIFGLHISQEVVMGGRKIWDGV